MWIWVFFFLLGGAAVASEETKDIYLWKGEHSLIGETLSIPHPLIVTGYDSVPSDVFQRVNRVLVAPYLDGANCSLNKDQYFSRKVEGILPLKTPLKVIKAFHVLKDPGLLRTFVLKLIDFFGVPGKGGPSIYYLVKDLKNQKFIMNSVVYFVTYGSTRYKKAVRIISDFIERGQTVQKVLLNFELSKESDEKCGYGWPKGKEPKRMKPAKEMKMIMEKALQVMEKYRSVYVFEHVRSHPNQIKVNVDDKALFFLILNSSPLRIKDISLVEGPL